MFFEALRSSKTEGVKSNLPPRLLDTAYACTLFFGNNGRLWNWKVARVISIWLFGILEKVSFLSGVTTSQIIKFNVLRRLDKPCIALSCVFNQILSGQNYIERVLLHLFIWSKYILSFADSLLLLQQGKKRNNCCHWTRSYHNAPMCIVFGWCGCRCVVRVSNHAKWQGLSLLWLWGLG